MPQAPQEQTAPITFTQDQLLAMLKELRKPADLTDDEKARKEGEKQRRADLAQLEHVKQRNRKLEQEYCTHLHIEDGKTRMVYVINGNYLICQACQKLARPEEDVKLFNYHFGQGNRTTF